MKELLVQTLSPQGIRLAKVIYDHTDILEIKRRFNDLKDETVERLCEWLKDNNETIKAEDCYDTQSGWYGVNFIVRGEDLSINGYCLSNKTVNEFINKQI